MLNLLHLTVFDFPSVNRRFRDRNNLLCKRLDLLEGRLLSTAKMLPFYTARFSTTEINYTFHRIPAPTLEISNISNAFVVPLPSTM